MSKTYRARQSPLKRTTAFAHEPFFRAVILLFMLTVNVMPVEAVQAGKMYSVPVMQGTTSLSFIAEADAYVHQSNPGTNYGNATSLLVNGANNPDVESFVRFTVDGAIGSIQNAQLRVYVTTNASANSPAVYGAGNNWTETGITWRNRPARTSNVLDNKASTRTNTWVEYNVSPFVTGNGTYTLVLVADSADSIRFSSSEGSRPPELVITFGSGAGTATATSTPTTTLLPSSTSTDSPTDTQSPPSTGTATPTMTEPPAASPTATYTATATALPSGHTVTFTTTADARVAQLNPTTNYGNVTTLQADGNSGEIQISYIRFTTSGISGLLQSVKLRVFCTTNGTTNGPAVYLANSSWIETGTGGITWNNRPALTSGAADNKTAFGANSWVEYDVTSLVIGSGTYTFALVADSTDGVVFSSREGTTPPQLVVTSGTSVPTATNPSPSPTVTQTPTVEPTASGSVTLVGAGDITSCTRSQDEQTSQLLDNIPGTVFTAGDNAYVDGTYTEYLNCYDPTWGRHKSRTKPSPGNHDYLTSGAVGYFQYFNNIPSYYAYDLGAWRIYSLNSEISVSATSAQATWLQNDLAANPNQCVLAYWHKPRWSSGSNHGDNTSIQPLWQILYDAGAELVINGHEHHYERFAEMNASGTAISQGLREIVVGTGGAVLYPFGSPKSASQVRNNTAYGVVKLTLHSNSYDWQFVPAGTGTFTDSGSTTCH
jgi:acid phosphatase type 7